MSDPLSLLQFDDDALNFAAGGGVTSVVRGRKMARQQHGKDAKEASPDAGPAAINESGLVQFTPPGSDHGQKAQLAGLLSHLAAQRGEAESAWRGAAAAMARVDGARKPGTAADAFPAVDVAIIPCVSPAALAVEVAGRPAAKNQKVLVVEPTQQAAMGAYAQIRQALPDATTLLVNADNQTTVLSASKDQDSEPSVVVCMGVTAALALSTYTPGSDPTVKGSGCKFPYSHVFVGGCTHLQLGLGTQAAIFQLRRVLRMFVRAPDATQQRGNSRHNNHAQQSAFSAVAPFKTVLCGLAPIAVVKHLWRPYFNHHRVRLVTPLDAKEAVSTAPAPAAETTEETKNPEEEQTDDKITAPPATTGRISSMGLLRWAGQDLASLVDAPSASLTDVGAASPVPNTQYTANCRKLTADFLPALAKVWGDACSGHPNAQDAVLRVVVYGGDSRTTSMLQQGSQPAANEAGQMVDVVDSVQAFEAGGGKTGARVVVLARVSCHGGLRPDLVVDLGTTVTQLEYFGEQRTTGAARWCSISEVEMRRLSVELVAEAAAGPSVGLRLGGGLYIELFPSQALRNDPSEDLLQGPAGRHSGPGPSNRRGGNNGAGAGTTISRSNLSNARAETDATRFTAYHLRQLATHGGKGALLTLARVGMASLVLPPPRMLQLPYGYANGSSVQTAPPPRAQNVMAAAPTATVLPAADVVLCGRLFAERAANATASNFSGTFMGEMMARVLAAASTPAELAPMSVELASFVVLAAALGIPETGVAIACVASSSVYQRASTGMAGPAAAARKANIHHTRTWALRATAGAVSGGGLADANSGSPSDVLADAALFVKVMLGPTPSALDGIVDEILAVARGSEDGCKCSAAEFKATTLVLEQFPALAERYRAVVLSLGDYCFIEDVDSPEKKARKSLQLLQEIANHAPQLNFMIASSFSKFALIPSRSTVTTGIQRPAAATQSNRKASHRFAFLRSAKAPVLDGSTTNSKGMVVVPTYVTGINEESDGGVLTANATATSRGGPDDARAFVSNLSTVSEKNFYAALACLYPTVEYSMPKVQPAPTVMSTGAPMETPTAPESSCVRFHISCNAQTRTLQIGSLTEAELVLDFRAGLNQCLGLMKAKRLLGGAAGCHAVMFANAMQASGRTAPTTAQTIQLEAGARGVVLSPDHVQDICRQEEAGVAAARAYVALQRGTLRQLAEVIQDVSFEDTLTHFTPYKESKLDAMDLLIAPEFRNMEPPIAADTAFLAKALSLNCGPVGIAKPDQAEAPVGTPKERKDELPSLPGTDPIKTPVAAPKVMEPVATKPVAAADDEDDLVEDEGGNFFATHGPVVFEDDENSD